MPSSSKTLNFYIFVTFTKWLVAMILGVSFIIFLVDLVEVLRRASSVPEVTLQIAATMSILRVPELLQEVMPILVLFSVIGALWWRSRSHELIVARATGLSIWQFLQPIMLTVLVFGALVVALFNPLSLHSSLSLKNLETTFFARDSSAPVIRVSSTGVWLREDLEKGAYRLVRAREVATKNDSATMSNIDLFVVGQSGGLLLSWHADTLTLVDGELRFEKVTDQAEPSKPKRIADQLLNTKLTIENLFKQNRTFGEVHFWQMPNRIQELKLAGAAFGETELRYTKLWSLPFVLVSMVLLAALFSLRMTRSGGVGKMILAGVTIAILLHFLTDILYSFALAGSLPIFIAVWSVPLTLSCVCSFFLLEHEDG
ncbi:MAG: LptF/LptG family permease [Alphaproteobacteria bacterium]